jgi:hypothetical protein
MTNDVHMRETLPWAYPDFDETQKILWGSKANSAADFLCVVFIKIFYKHVSNENSHLKISKNCHITRKNKQISLI